jgi:hypothetical protein
MDALSMMTGTRNKMGGGTTAPKDSAEIKENNTTHK